MKKFTLGMIAGMSSLALAVPILAQVSSAQTEDDAATSRPVPTQACLLAMADLEDAHASVMDGMIALHKQQLQARADALRSVAAIADDDERQAALKDMHEDMRDTMKEATPPEAVMTAMDAVKEACGDVMRGFGMGHGPMGMHGGKPFMMKLGRGPVPADLAEKLGITTDELQAAIESGKTIEEIATEKGIELPARPGHRAFFQKFLGEEQ